MTVPERALGPDGIGYPMAMDGASDRRRTRRVYSAHGPL